MHGPWDPIDGSILRVAVTVVQHNCHFTSNNGGGLVGHPSESTLHEKTQNKIK